MRLIIERIHSKRRYSVTRESRISARVTLSEDEYLEINQWCIDNLGYHARSAYDLFDFRTDSDATAFILRWS